MEKNKKHYIVAGIAALLMASAMGLNVNTMGVYLQPMATSLNISMGAISTHSMLLSLGIAFGAFTVTPALKRYSIRFIILVSAIVMAVATFTMSFGTQVWMFNVLGFIRGFAASFSGIITLQFLINNWFVSKRGLVTSFVFSFSGVAGVLFSPLLAGIIENLGWRMALVIHSGLFILLSLPGILLPYSLKPEDEGLKPYRVEEKQKEEIGNEETVFKVARKPYSIRSITFIAVLFISLFIPMLTAISQHLAGMSVDLGFNATLGALMISACMLGNIVFKLIIGVLSDLFGVLTAIYTMGGVAALGIILLLTTQSNSIVLIGSLLIGAVYSIAAVGMPLLVNHLYSAMEFPKVFPIVNFLGGIGGAIGVSLYGFSFDLSGGYTLSLVVSIALLILVMSLVFTANYMSVEKSKAIEPSKASITTKRESELI